MLSTLGTSLPVVLGLLVLWHPSTASSPCWETSRCQDLTSQAGVVACARACRAELSAEAPVFPGNGQLQPLSESLRRYVMSHFRWGKFGRRNSSSGGGHKREGPTGGTQPLPALPSSSLGLEEEEGREEGKRSYSVPLASLLSSSSSLRLEEEEGREEGKRSHSMPLASLLSFPSSSSSLGLEEEEGREEGKRSHSMPRASFPSLPSFSSLGLEEEGKRSHSMPLASLLSLPSSSSSLGLEEEEGREEGKRSHSMPLASLLSLPSSSSLGLEEEGKHSHSMPLASLLSSSSSSGQEEEKSREEGKHSHSMPLPSLPSSSSGLEEEGKRSHSIALASLLSLPSSSSSLGLEEEEGREEGKRSYSMEHFRWGKPVGRKRRPVKVYPNGVEEESSAESYPLEFRRELGMAGGTEEEEEEGQEEEEEAGGSSRGRRRRWRVPAKAKRYGGFMSWEHSQTPLLTLLRNTMGKSAHEKGQ